MEIPSVTFCTRGFCFCAAQERVERRRKLRSHLSSSRELQGQWLTLYASHRGIIHLWFLIPVMQEGRHNAAMQIEQCRSNRKQTE